MDKISKYSNLKSLKKKAAQTKNWSFTVNQENVDKILNEKIDLDYINNLRQLTFSELNLNVSDDEIEQYLESVKIELKKRYHRQPTKAELERELSVNAFKIDDISEFKDLLWDERANYCDEKTCFIQKLFAKTLFGRLKSFNIKKIAEGEGAPVIFINGFLTEGETAEDWKKAIANSFYKNNPCYLVEWESSNTSKIFKDVFSTGVIASAIRSTIGAGIAGAAVTGIVSSGNPLAVGGGVALGSAASIALTPLKHWYNAMKKTEKVGDMLSYIVTCVIIPWDCHSDLSN